MKKIISIYKNFGNLIITRDAVATFMGNLENLLNKEIILDFKKIEFISRSAAHEYLKQKSILSKEIKEINLSSNVLAMFLLVKRQINKISQTQ